MWLEEEEVEVLRGFPRPGTCPLHYNVQVKVLIDPLPEECKLLHVLSQGRIQVVKLEARFASL